MSSSMTNSVASSMIPWLPNPGGGGGGGGGGDSSSFFTMETIKPGEVILRKLFHEFTILADKKIDQVLNNEPLERPFAKSLQRGEDPIFDQLLTAFGAAAEHCLPSQLRVLFEWHDRQLSPTSAFSEDNLRLAKTASDSQSSSSKSAPPTKVTNSASSAQAANFVDQISELEIYYILEKRDLAIEFIFCLVLIEVLKQLPLHPGYDELTAHIENLAFKRFKFREDVSNPNLANINMIADLYAEVIGVLAQSRFQSVRKRFMADFKELRAKEPSPIVTHNIISLLMGMKFFRVKMVPIEEFEASFQFMHECAVYFLEVKDKDLKHALAGLFVEILVPVAATVKNEVNVPCLKNFVELLYNPTLDLCTKRKHCLALFPLVTCLLCVSQKQFFLSSWHYFLAMCLSHLKNRDPKMSRVALESLYRLLWVYMIRIKCESNTATQSRLHSIVNSLFPKGSKAVVPRDTPLNIFVKIIQFIAQERLDFAMKEIVFDLLSVGRSIKIILTPERMSIGLRSFLVVADSLQQKDGEPPMPRSLGVLPSGNTLRVKKTFLNKMLTDEMAKNIGMNHYYPYVRKTLSDILRALDVQFGRPLMATNVQNFNKEPDDMITGERKPKIDLFRTCIAAIPRLIPDGIAKNDLIDLLARLTVHMDEEMSMLAFQSLTNLVVDFTDWREDVIDGFVHFVLYDIGDQFQPLIENALKMLFQLMNSWKNAIQTQIGVKSKVQSPSDLHHHHHHGVPLTQSKMDQIVNVLYKIEALSLVMLCYCRQPIRKLAAFILKETKMISNLISGMMKLNVSSANVLRVYDEPVGSVIDAICPLIIESCFPYISSNERATITAMCNQVDLQWVAERGGASWVLFERISDTNLNEKAGGTDSGRSSEARSESRSTTISSVNPSQSNPTPVGTVSSHQSMTSSMSSAIGSSIYSSESTTDGSSPADDELKLNAWSVCLMAMMNEVMVKCPNVTSFCWNYVFVRLKTLFSQIDPNPVNDNRSLILRGSTSSSNLKRSISSFDRSFFIELWKNYLMMACCVAPSSIVTQPTNPTPPPSQKYPQSHHQQATSSMLQENCTSPDSSLSEKISSQQQSGTQSIEGNRSPVIQARGRSYSVQNLFKMTIELVRCEQVDLRKAVILGLSQVNPNALADLLEELIPFFREAIDRKQNEKLRSRKRRELLRVQIGRLFKFISERKIFAQCPAVVLDNRDNYSLSSVLIEYIDGVRMYLESETDKMIESSSYILDIKQSYCHFICSLVKSFPIEQRTNKLSRELRQNLFNLFAGWSGKYGQMFLNSNYQYPSAPLDFTGITELEFLSIKSMSTVLCSGSLFDQKNLLDGNSLYYWLTSLLNSKERRINEIGLDTLILLLENNLDAGPLLEWLVECCYTKNAKIADACFTALATIFSIREYPCDRYIAIIIVTIVNVACPRIEIQQLALQLLQILDARFFTGSSSYRSHDRSGTALESSPRGGLKNAEDVKVGHSRGQLQRSNYQLGIGANSGSNHNHHGTSSAGGGPLGLEPLLLNLYPCTQANIAKRMAYLHPQLTMIVFSEITYRFQTARPTVCQNLLNFLVPWLYNMQLVDPTAAVIGSLFVNENVHHHHHPSSVVNLQDPDDPGTPPPGIYSRNAFEDPMQHSYGSQFNGATREGWGSVESTEMVLNNLFFITIKFGDDYAPELEKVWSSICVNRPNNLKIIIRYLFILTGLSPNELLPYAKRIAICLAKSQPEHLIDILMTELQAVEFLSFNAERTEAFPYFRIVNRKCSASHLLDDADVPNVRRIDSTTRDAGTLHTKRHSKDLHGKYLDQPMVSIPGGNESNGSTTTGGIASSNTSSEECNIFGELNLSNDDSSLPISERCTKPSTPQPRPLPMPEYGGYYAPLNDFLLNTSTNGNGTNFMNGLPLPLSGGGFPAVSGSMGGFHRCNLALMLLTDIITQDIQVVDWSPHIPLMLHILFLGMDHSKSIVYEHCKQLLLNLLIVGTKHRDNLNVARILLNNRIQRQTHGLSMPFQFPYTHLNYMITGDGDVTDATAHDHRGTSPSSGSGVNKGSVNPNGDLDLNRIFTKSTENVVGSSPVGATSTSPEAVNLQDIQLNIDKISEGSESGGKNSKNQMFQHAEMMNNTSERQKFSLDCYIKTLIDFISSKQGAPLWNYEDITAKLWQIKSGEQIGCFVEHVLFVFKESIPYAKIENRWAEIALQLALSCSSRHYAGRSLQIFRALKIPINTRMLSDILSRLVETISEQGEDMQGYVTELMLTLESAIDSFDFKPRNILELINEYFHFEVDMEEEDELDDHEHGNNHDGLLEEEDDHDLNDTELELPGTNASTPKKDQGHQQDQDHEFINTSGGTTSETNDTLPSTSSSSTLVTTGGAPGGIPTSQSHTDSLANSKVQLKMPLRSTSYSMSFPTRKFNFLDDGRQSGSSSSATRFRTTTDVDQFYSNGGKGSGGGSNSRTGMGRSQSVQSLMKNAGDYGSDSEQPNQAADYPTFDDKTSILAQFFWIAVILLETDYEHEFALALRLLDKVLEKVSLEDPECQEKIEKIFVHFKWHNFPGVHALLLKGFACPGNYEATIHLLHKLTPLLKISVIDPTKSETAFPFHVMAMLPYMLNNYDDPSPLCIQAAVSFAQWCNENSSKLENLATVMTLYSKRCFSKENSQWIKCVVKYLYDAYPNSFVGIISFLVEVAEKGHQSYLPHILSILHFMLNYIDLSTARLINVDILRVANRYIEGPQWKDALKILKLAVSRSSSLAAPSYSSSANYPSSIISSIVSCGAYSDCISIASSSFAESEFSAAKQRELPGRTMDFAIDLSQTPIVGYKFIQKRQQMFNSVEQQQNSMDSGVQESNQEQQQQEFATENSSGSGNNNNKRSNRESRIPLEKLFEVKETIQIPPSTSTPPAAVVNSVNPENPNSNTLKRTVSGQVRIRERLIGLLNRCGQRIGGLPKSPSVIFSQNSDIIECHAKSSMASSVEELSATNNDVSNDSKHDDTAHGEFAFFKEFDFLEYELESQEGESLDNFNWGVRRKSLSNLDNSLTNETERPQEGGGTGGGLGGSISYSTGTLKPSSSDHQRSSIVVTSIGTGQANAQLKNVQKVDNDFSSDDEVESVSPLYDGGATNSGSHHLTSSSSHHHHHHGHQHQLSHHSQGGSSTSSSHHNQDNQNNHLRNSSRPSSLISHGSSHSLGSDTEQYTITSVTPINIITEPALPEAEDPNQEEEEEEESIEQWSSHFIQLINDNTGTTSAMSNQILALIFRNTFSKVIELTRECCDLLPLNSPDSHIATISPKFFDLLEIVSSPVDFPFVFIDPKLFITIPKLLERHRFSILELHAHWETYNEKRDAVIDVLQKCQRAVLRSQQASQQQDGVLDGVSVSKLCKMMYKMHFQLFLLFECYLKFVDILKSIAEESEVQNYSTEISNIKLELAKCLSNVMEDLITGSSESGSETFNSLPIEGTSLTKENEEELKRLIQSGQYAKAVKLVHVFKENIPDLFSDDCIEAILTIYCRSIFDNQSSYLVVTEHNLGKITRQLRETSYEINNLCLS